MSITFTAEGTPAPQGSKIRTRYGMFESSKRLMPWREIVTRAATKAGDDAALLGPLKPPYRVDVWFYIQRPKTTRATHPVAPTVGDLDKLVRAVGDALTASGLIVDDRFIVTQFTNKAWAEAGENPGATIRVTELT